MKCCIRLWGCLVFVLLTGQALAQNFAGQWQGVEVNPGAEMSVLWPSQLTLRSSATGLSGTLYQVPLSAPEYSATYRMRGVRTGAGLRLSHAGVLNEVTPEDVNWCQGTLIFTYDAALEKLTGRSAYPTRGCHNGTLELYRVRLKSARTVPAGLLSTLRVSGRNVRWFADADLRRPLAAGNTYRTRLRRTTTFYITQGFYPTSESPVVPVTVRVDRPAATPAPAAPPAPPVASLPPVAAPMPAPIPPAPPAPVPAPTPAPLVLPAVLFRLGTAELRPESDATLTQLAAYLQANAGLRVRVAGHTDRIGEADKNQILSEQRATAVKSYLVRQGGIAAGRIETVGYGDKRPLYVSPDERNRRVEVTFLN